MPIINQMLVMLYEMLVMLYELMAIAFQPQSLFLALMLQDAPNGFSCLAWNRLGGAIAMGMCWCGQKLWKARGLDR